MMRWHPEESGVTFPASVFCGSETRLMIFFTTVKYGSAMSDLMGCKTGKKFKTGVNIVRFSILILTTFNIKISLAETHSHNTNKFKVFSVSDYDLMLNNKPAISISFGESDTNYCSLTINKENITQGIKISSERNRDKMISIDCNWNGGYFVQSSNHATYATFSIISLENDKKIAEIEVSLKIINPSEDKYFEVKDSKISISGNNFENLVR